MKPKLISFNLCPFVQRAAIVLAHKGIDHDVDYIELSSPPSWFLEISPLKKVPVLQIGEDVIFDSTVINEFLNEAYPGELHPEDVFMRAKNRSWIEYGGECMLNSHRLAISETEAVFKQERDALWEKLDRLEPEVQADPYFNGAEFSLVDAAYAPMFLRLDYLAEVHPDIYDARRHPNIVKWKEHLLALDSVKGSVIPDLQSVFSGYVAQREGYFARFL